MRIVGGAFRGRALAAPGAAGLLLLEQPHFAKEVSRVEIGDHHFLAVIVFQNDRDRALDNVIEGVAGIPFVDDGGPVGVTTTMAVGQKVVEILDMRRYGHERHVGILLGSARKRRTGL